MNKEELIKYFNLILHPEGGAYKETYRSELKVSLSNFIGERHVSTGIYFLLGENEISAFHRIKSDEMWHFYLGGPLDIYEIDKVGRLNVTILGQNILNGEKLQYTVKAGNWFAAIPNSKSNYSFVGCTVSPGFDFNDFEMADRDKLLKEYPEHFKIINKLTYSK